MVDSFNNNTTTTINPQLLTLNTNVGQLLSHSRSGSDVVYMVSPDASASVGSHPFSFEDLETPISVIDDGSPQSFRQNFGDHSVKPLQPTMQQQAMTSFQLPTGLQDISPHSQQIYPPDFGAGFSSHSPHASIIVTPAGEPEGYSAFTNVSPFTIECNDFLQAGRHSVGLECTFDNYDMVTKLRDDVNNGHLVVQTARGFGNDTALSALQNGLSAAFPEKLPPSEVQLGNLLRNTTTSIDLLDHSSLATVLEKYGFQNGRQLQLGILNESQPGLYKATIYSSTQYGFPISNVAVTTIWLYFDSGNIDLGLQATWSAFVPPKFLPRRRISYAEAASTTTATPQVSVSVPPPRPSRYLEPPTSSTSGRSRNASPRRGARASSRQIRPRSGGSISLPAQKRPTTPLQNSIEASNKYACKNCTKTFETHSELIHHQRKYNNVTKNHVCRECHKAFMYPKDLRRHESTHTGEKKYKCPICPKSFTRKDNLGRHVRDDHGGPTPSESDA